MPELKLKKLIIVAIIIPRDTTVAPVGGKNAKDAIVPKAAKATLIIFDK